MGITKRDCKLLFYGKSLNVSYKKTLMLGRLNLFVTKEDIINCIKKYKNNAKEVDDVDFLDEYSEPLFKILGAETVESIDFSDYEKATIIHDLNQPIHQKYYDSFTCIVDGGTIEHVFNFPVAIQNCMKALKVGGHYIGITPTNNQLGHGFYQFSPELYYRVFSEENGFVVKKMYIAPSDDETKDDGSTTWYEVADPKIVNSRVTLVNNLPLLLMFIAEKVQAKEIFEKIPQQSDYASTWNVYNLFKDNSKATNHSTFKLLYRRLPERIRMVLRNIYDLYRIEKLNRDGLGTLNPEHFRKVEV